MMWALSFSLLMVKTNHKKKNVVKHVTQHTKCEEKYGRHEIKCNFYVDDVDLMP